MSPVPELVFESTGTLTQSDFAKWVARRPADDLNHYELLEGRVIMTPPAGYPHGSIGGRVAARIGAFVTEQGLGECLDASQGFELPSGDTVEPDFAFVHADRWAAMPTPRRGEFLTIVPDLVTEILSPSTASKDRGTKRAIYERNGVAEYWLVDADARELIVFTREAERFDDGVPYRAGTIFRSRVLPGFELDVATILPPVAGS